MMLSKLESGDDDSDGGNSNNGQLLCDIEAISKALYLHKNPQRARSKSVERPRLSESKSSLNPIANDIVSYKDKKSSSSPSSSLWNWKNPLKALAHIGYRKFNFCFFLHVHSVEGLPPSFDDFNVSVHWKRKDEVLQTRPCRVLKGIAEFDETLMHKCCVYGSRSGPQSSAKYEMKLFMISVSVIEDSGIDMGQHWVDLTRLLPFTLEELEGEKSTGRWTTSFKLANKAKGATLNVSFGFLVMKDNLVQSRSNMNVIQLLNLSHSTPSTTEPFMGFGRTNSNRMLRRVGSVPSNLNRESLPASQSIATKIHDEILPNLGLELSKSINFLYQKLNEANWHSSEEVDTLSAHLQPLERKDTTDFKCDKDVGGNESDDTDFDVIEHGIEFSPKELFEAKQVSIQADHYPPIEIINVDEIIKDDVLDFDGEENFHLEDELFCSNLRGAFLENCKHEGNSVSNRVPSMKDLESAFHNLLISETLSESVGQEVYNETKSNYGTGKAVKRSLSLDESTESVATEFLNMLGIDHSPFGSSSDGEPESPRERLLREFEKEALACGNFIIDYDADGEYEEFGSIAPVGSVSEEGELSLVIQAADKEHKKENRLLSRRREAKSLEDLETEALMREWGLDENAFQNSPCNCSDGFGSPIEVLPEEPVALPPLGDGFGPFIHTNDGGYMRSMNPSSFRNSKTFGSLVMQISCPVVLPADIGYDILEILQHLASVGIEKLSLQANKLMPLEDITGRTLEQIARDAVPEAAAVPDKLASPHPESRQYIVGLKKEVGEFCSGCDFNDMESTLVGVEMGSDYVTLANLVPLAMNKIEALSIEGLIIQSGMSEAEAPSSINAQTQSVGKMPAFKGKGTNLGGFLSLVGAEELLLHDASSSDSDDCGILSLSITLEEWLRLDAGFVDDQDQVSERMKLILAAHHARCVDFTNERITGGGDMDKAQGRKQGLLGNNLTLAFRMLLRDPLRNYEAVGASMLALFKVDRAILHPRPKVYGTVFKKFGGGEEDLGWIQKEDTSDNKRVEREEEGSLRFKITEVHLSGLNAESDKLQLWGTKPQRQYGTRWLLASGMSRSEKQVSKSKAVVVSYPRLTTKLKTGGILWSISSQANDTEMNRKKLTGFFPYIRNPDVIFPK